MKKTLLIAAVTLLVGTVNAQQPNFGVKAGVNFATLKGENIQGLDSRRSFHLGFVAELEVSENFSIQPEILYSGLGATVSDEGTYKLDYISIPIMAKYFLVDRLSLEAGPQIGFNVIAESETDYNGETKKIKAIEPFELAAGFGAGYQFPIGLFFAGRYIFGITDAWEYPPLKNNVLQLSAGYKF